MYNNEKTENKEDIFRDKELLKGIKQLKNGDEQGFATIYHKTYKYVYSRAKSMFSDEQTAQDLVQEVYVAVYRSIHTLQSDESLYAWLRTITFQQGTMLMRKDRKELLLSEDNEEMFDAITDENVEIENDYVDKQDIEIIRECINRLSSEHKSIVMAYYYDNLKVDDIAELFNISTGTIKSRLFSARKKLKGYIEEAEAKQGYKLHSFSGITFALAIKSLLNENMTFSQGQMELQFSSICGVLGIQTASIVSVGTTSAVTGAKATTMKSLFAKVASLGTKKIIATAIGTTLIAGSIGVIDKVLDIQSNVPTQELETNTQEGEDGLSNRWTSEKMPYYDSNGELIYYYYYVYEDKNAVEKWIEELDETAYLYEVREYDKGGNVISCLYYDKNGVETYSIFYERDEAGKKKKSTVISERFTEIREYNSNEIPIRVTIYLKEKGLYDSEVAYIVYKCNDEGVMLGGTVYDADGKNIGYIEMEYFENGNIKKETLYNKEGKIRSIAEYKEDGSGLTAFEKFSDVKLIK